MLSLRVTKPTLNTVLLKQMKMTLFAINPFQMYDSFNICPLTSISLSLLSFTPLSACVHAWNSSLTVSLGHAKNEVQNFSHFVLTVIFF